MCWCWSTASAATPPPICRWIPARPSRAAAGVDLNFIPLDAIDHVEVLTDGAAAQYGSDAIAGVVNIILKNSNSGGTVAGTYGQYGNNGGGRTEDVSGNAGFEAGSGGFFNITGDFRDHGHSNVGAIDPRLLPQNLSTTYPDNNAVNAPGFPYLNRISGDAAVQQKIALLNSGFNFDRRHGTLCIRHIWPQGCGVL